MCKIICLGEIMLRLNPADYLRFLQAESFEASYAGSEASVAVSLSNFGMNAKYVTKLPNNELGQAALNSLRKFGVDTTCIQRDDHRLGIYFVEKGSSQRPSKVIYDRKYSSISLAIPEDFDWDTIFQSGEWFHFSGITPALGDQVAEVCLRACKEAKSRGLRVSCDLNYRNKLWSTEQASEVMTKLMKYVDVLIGNEEDAEKVFGITAGDFSKEHFQNIDIAPYISITKQLADKFNLEYVGLTLRESLSADRNIWSGILYDGKKHYVSNKYDINIVDRLGGGDSFAAGLIFGILSNYESRETIDFAVGASCLKHTMHYDFNLATVDEVKSLISGDVSGRIQR